MKNLKKLGKVLGKQEQKSISGGTMPCHSTITNLVCCDDTCFMLCYSTICLG